VRQIVDFEEKLFFFVVVWLFLFVLLINGLVSHNGQRELHFIFVD